MSTPAPSTPPTTTPLVADASSVVFLEILGLTSVLVQLYDQVLVPDVVRDEIERGRLKGDPGPDLATVAWARVVPTPPIPPELRRRRMDDGERAVLAVALELASSVAPWHWDDLGIDWAGVVVLVDDKQARRVAWDLRVPSTGVLGVLLRAKEANMIPAVRPYVDRLLAAGFWVKPGIVADVLAKAGE